MARFQNFVADAALKKNTFCAVSRTVLRTTKKADRKTRSISKTVASGAPAIATAFVSQNPLTEHLDLEFSAIIDAIDPTVAITESLVRLFEHTSKNPSDYPDKT